MAIRHETLKKLCERLDDPVHGLKNTGDRENRDGILNLLIDEVQHAQSNQ